MNKVAEFNITESFNITGRGLAVFGTIICGEINTGDSLFFNDASKKQRLKISSIEFVRKGGSMDYIGLLFDYEDDAEKARFMNLKVSQQIAIVTP